VEDEDPLRLRVGAGVAARAGERFGEGGAGRGGGEGEGGGEGYFAFFGAGGFSRDNARIANLITSA